MPDTSIPREVIFYIDGNGKEPFTKWFDGIRDAKVRRCILRSLEKLRQGIYGDHTKLKYGSGVIELRVHLGPGYRIYFGDHGHKSIILIGSDKNSQNDVVKRAEDYWIEYKVHEKL